jgi:UDP-N-acetylglucosamine--N-acetylmuramyl-(pentapeptide) pyrophosphoryl-undecaprenol N-acetylglucosamine transferase
MRHEGESMMRGPMARPIILAAGGTAGHFFPAEALAGELIARGHRVVLFTDARTGVPQAGVFAGRECFVIPGAGLAGRGPWRGMAAIARLVGGVLAARRLFLRLRPAALVAFGGYPAVAPVLAARFLRPRPPVLLHEQNAVLGRANRFLVRRATALAVSFPATQRLPPGVTPTFTGNPVRPAVAALAGAPYAPAGATDEIRLLVLGGSLGARVMSDVVPGALALLPDPLRARLRLAQQCRAEDLVRVRDAYRRSGIAAELAPFIADLPARLADAHLVIARAGASTVAELAALGRPAILVPLPSAIDDHQTANARALEAAGGALLMAEAGLSVDSLAAALAALLGDPARLRVMATGAGALGRVGAAALLADLTEHHLAPDQAGMERVR